MILLSMQQAVALLIISCFTLGVIVDRTVIWIQNAFESEEDEDAAEA